MRHHLPFAMVLVSAGLLAAGCVTQGAFDKKVTELEKLRADAARDAEAREAKLKADLAAAIAEREKKQAELEQQLKEKEAALAAATAERDALRKQLDDANALAGQLKAR